MISFKNISKSFNQRNIITDISGNFDTGKINFLIGASGTGKSVLLKCLVGILQPDEGTVFYDNTNFYNTNKREQSKIRREMGMLFQGGALFDSKNIEDNVRFPLDMLTKMTMEEKIERTNFCLQRVGLVNINKKMPSEISGGMKKRVGIARAIVNKPKYLFCDEPNSGLDPQTGIKIDQLIHQITHENNMTTIIVSHDMNSVIEIGEKVIFLYKGEKKWEGTNDDILDTDIEELNDFIFATKLMRKFLKKN